MATNIEEKATTFSNTMSVRLMGCVTGIDPRFGVLADLEVYDIIHCDVDPKLGLLEHVVDVENKWGLKMGGKIDLANIPPDIPRQVQDLKMMTDLEVKQLREKGVEIKITNVAYVSVSPNTPVAHP